ncbi:Hsp20/alpha crystallin family protein [bacterium]|nr:Hsp20/alpha crystallin family protein [bacterium]
MRLIEPNTGLSLREAVSRMMDDNFVRQDRGLPTMPVDVLETNDSILVKAQIPGSSKEQIEIHYEKDILTLKATVPAEVAPEGGKFLLRERGNGDITRTFRLPFPVDPEKAQAEYHDGVLSLTLPKLESARPRQITIH